MPPRLRFRKAERPCQAGCQLSRVHQCWPGGHHRGSSDATVAKASADEGRVLVTLDLHFGDW